ncbi:hypothetical protein [Priestia megaterium]|uniref:hypothetical protein n=1 Tax=Priestia megaterium TaxID=1404 RepID=UPI0025B1CC5C|nr:hypothetical protein [Priestia megaterium]MDN3229543.1 hypothetical protein [Priestia megaterium]
MKNFSISRNAIGTYLQLFQVEIEKLISSMYNPEFLIKENDFEYSFLFLDDSVLVLIIKGDNLLDLRPLDYEYFISNDIMLQFLKMTDLPPRIKRYCRLGSERLKEEIKDGLKIGSIYSDHNNNSIIWSDFDLQFEIDDSLRLATIKK